MDRQGPPGDVNPADDSTVLYRPDSDATVLAARVLGVGSAPLASANLPLGFMLHEYRIDAVLGQGGFGVTYLATDVHLNAKVAIKEYLPAEVAQRASDKSVSPRWEEDASLYRSGLDNFLIEARTLATFRHPNIVRVARFFEANRTAYMVLEYERGKPLKAWWEGRKELGEAELLSQLQPLLDGLAVVHAAGFLHRDIKPDNIYVRKHDASWVLLDFGAARATASSGSALADVVTPGYAPVEQYGDGEQGPWTDIYALGATLYWMISGAKPAPAPQRAQGDAVITPAVEVGKGRYSEPFLRAIDWALQVDARERPQSLEAFCQMLFASHVGSLGLQDALRADRARQLGRVLFKPGSWPLAVKMTIAMVVAALAPMLITANYNLNGTVAAVTRGELLELESLAQSTAGRIGQLVNDCRNLAGFLASNQDFVAYLQAPDAARREVIETKLANLVATNPDVRMVMLVNKEGLALVSNEPAVRGKNFGFREYFRQAVHGRAFKTGIIVSSTDGMPGMYFANPVLDQGGEVIGVVVLRIRGASFAAILDEVKSHAGLAPFMVDGDGVLIHHPDRRYLHRSLAPLTPYAQLRIADDQRFGKARIDSVGMPELARAMVGTARPGNLSYRSTISGQEEHAGYAPVRGHDWVVGVTESRDAFEEPLRRLHRTVLASVVLVGLVFLVMAVLFARSIVRPIARLTEAANALKEGDYDRANIKVTSNDEIGRLARTFNVMIDVLRQREREKPVHRKRASGRD